MIHLTVAPPLGIDSLFFNYVQRLAELNSHRCLDVPAEQLNSNWPSQWIETMSQSNEHHFLIGYRYPPHYWKELMQWSATVAVLADGNSSCCGLYVGANRIHTVRQKSNKITTTSSCF
jgi:hypothetical protein